jgi:Polyketide cyclase / dehydrase and lipid transport
MKRARVRAALAAAVLIAAAPCAGAFAASDAPVVEHRGDEFRITFDAVIDAPPRSVYAVLTDFAALRELNPAIVAASAEPAPGGRGERVRMVLESCILLFCRKVVQVEDVVEPDAHTILSRIVPGLGDFKSGRTTWTLAGRGGKTLLHYEASRVPGFWIPPLIGPWAVAHSLRAQLRASIPVLERLAGTVHPVRAPSR